MDDLLKSLKKAIKKGDNAKLDELVAQGVSLTNINEHDENALFLAAYHGHITMLEHLLKHYFDKRIDLQQTNRNDQNILFLAVAGGRITMLKYLRSNYLNEKSLTKKDLNSNTLLLTAAYYGQIAMLDYLLNTYPQYFSLKDINRNGNTVLHLVVEKEKIDAVCFLLRRQANIFVTNKNGQTPLDLAKEKKNTTLINLLKNPQNVHPVVPKKKKEKPSGSNSSRKNNTNQQEKAKTEFAEDLIIFESGRYNAEDIQTTKKLSEENLTTLEYAQRSVREGINQDALQKGIKASLNDPKNKLNTNVNPQENKKNKASHKEKSIEKIEDNNASPTTQSKIKKLVREKSEKFYSPKQTFSTSDLQYLSTCLEYGKGKGSYFKEINLARKHLFEKSKKLEKYLIRHLKGNNGNDKLQIHTLNLSDNALTDAVGPCIASVLEKNTQLETLILANNLFSTETTKALAKELSGNGHLKTLDLSLNNNLNDTSIEELIKGLKNNYSLTCLKISGKKVTKLQYMKLEDALSSRRENQVFILNNEKILNKVDFTHINTVLNKIQPHKYLGNTPVSKTNNRTIQLLKIAMDSERKYLYDIDSNLLRLLTSEINNLETADFLNLFEIINFARCCYLEKNINSITNNNFWEVDLKAQKFIANRLGNLKSSSLLFAFFIAAGDIYSYYNAKDLALSFFYSYLFKLPLVERKKMKLTDKLNKIFILKIREIINVVFQQEFYSSLDEKKSSELFGICKQLYNVIEFFRINKLIEEMNLLYKQFSPFFSSFATSLLNESGKLCQSPEKNNLFIESLDVGIFLISVLITQNKSIDAAHLANGLKRHCDKNIEISKKCPSMKNIRHYIEKINIYSSKSDGFKSCPIPYYSVAFTSHLKLKTILDWKKNITILEKLRTDFFNKNKTLPNNDNGKTISFAQRNRTSSYPAALNTPFTPTFNPFEKRSKATSFPGIQHSSFVSTFNPFATEEKVATAPDMSNTPLTSAFNPFATSSKTSTILDAPNKAFYKLNNFSNEVKKLIAEICKDIKSLLGEPPCLFTLVGIGSLARNELAPYSDFDCAFLIQSNEYKQDPYFRWFYTLLHLCLNMLCEPEGLHLDAGDIKNFEVGHLLDSPQNLITTMKECGLEDPENINTTLLVSSSEWNSLIRPIAIYSNDNSNTLLNEYKQRLISILKLNNPMPKNNLFNTYQQLARNGIEYRYDLFSPNKKNYQNQLKSNKSLLINLKDYLVSPLTLLCQDLALYYRVFTGENQERTVLPYLKFNCREILESLKYQSATLNIEPNKLDGLLNLLNELHSLRIKSHLKFKRQEEQFNVVEGNIMPINSYCVIQKEKFNDYSDKADLFFNYFKQKVNLKPELHAAKKEQTKVIFAQHRNDKKSVILQKDLHFVPLLPQQRTLSQSPHHFFAPTAPGQNEEKPNKINDSLKKEHENRHCCKNLIYARLV